MEYFLTIEISRLVEILCVIYRWYTPTYISRIADQDQVNKQINQFILNLLIVGMCMSNYGVYICDSFLMSQSFSHINVSFQKIDLGSTHEPHDYIKQLKPYATMFRLFFPVIN